ncbi:heart- and neural crest derivatives-expressed protein 2-like isoform X2 [Contarinia nasturtii]|nr:heart- and neural crest derivatives-expressed protein 2-like isoform X2 [Contarinia nasturtii]
MFNVQLDRSNQHRILFTAPSATVLCSEQTIQCKNYERIYYSETSTKDIEVNPPFVRTGKRRTTANKKERRRTQSINSAFAFLRDCIPNVPSDTKLSKIKTLRLATSYITYLNGVLKGDQDPSSEFRAEILSSRKINAERKAKVEAQNNSDANYLIEPKRNKVRTGWPQDCWEAEITEHLKTE